MGKARLKDEETTTPFSSPCMDCYNVSFHKTGYYCREKIWDDRGTPQSVEHSGDKKRGKCNKRFEIKEA